jgi:hypothetical protein|nr:MAG TPA: hypothetical protein [Caudoviricetes sp.]
MYFVEKTTASERIDIANAIYAPLCDLERAHRLLCTFWNDYLDSKEDRPKTRYEWEDVEDRVSVIMDIVCTAIFECKLAYADEEAVTQYLETAQQLQAAKAVHDARDAIQASYRNRRMPEPDAVMHVVDNALSLPDDQALPILQTILKGEGGNQA